MLFFKNKKDLLLKGVLDGEKAFLGPEIVQFDITNRCNNNCVCCWNNSPFMGEPGDKKKEELSRELPAGLIIKTIGELKKMGTKILFFAGGGEPFIHPHIMDILEYAKKCNMRIYINSNFTLIDYEKAKRLVELKIDHIHASLLAGQAMTYAEIHPNKSEETFHKIKDVLLYISYLKREKKQHLYNPMPHINLYYVIFNKNYAEIDKMIDLAIELKADSVEFTPIDAMPGTTDCLLLDKRQINSVLNDVNLQSDRLDKYNINEPVKTNITQKNSFLKRLASGVALKGHYESETITSQPCYAGWVFARIKADGEVNPCLKAHRISIGNIYDQSFAAIWNSPEEMIFRKKLLTWNLMTRILRI